MRYRKKTVIACFLPAMRSPREGLRQTFLAPSKGLAQDGLRQYVPKKLQLANITDGLLKLIEKIK